MQFLNGAEQAVAGIVDDDVETAEIPLGVLDRSEDRGLVRHIQNWRPKPRDEPVMNQFLLMEISQDRQSY